MVLSTQEKRIMGLVSNGLCSKEIGATLAITNKTVDWHVGNVLVKLCVRSRAHAVAVALARGWVDPPRAETQVSTRTVITSSARASVSGVVAPHAIVQRAVPSSSMRDSAHHSCARVPVELAPPSRSPQGRGSHLEHVANAPD